MRTGLSLGARCSRDSSQTAPAPEVVAKLRGASFGCDDPTLAALEQRLASDTRTAKLRVHRSDRVPGTGFSWLCVDAEAGHPCPVWLGSAPSGSPGPLFVALSPTGCSPGAFLSARVKLKTVSSSELERVRNELLDTGWFSRVDLRVGEAANGHPRVAVDLEVSEGEALCRAAGQPWTTGRPSCPERPGCQYGMSCVTRQDGCEVCTCDTPDPKTTGLMHLVLQLVGLE